jgi:hypothetical protein
MSPQQQDNQDDEQDCAEPAPDIRAAIVESPSSKQDQQNDDEDYEIHHVPPLQIVFLEES